MAAAHNIPFLLPLWLTLQLDNSTVGTTLFGGCFRDLQSTEKYGSQITGVQVQLDYECKVVSEMKAVQKILYKDITLLTNLVFKLNPKRRCNVIIISDQLKTVCVTHANKSFLNSVKTWKSPKSIPSFLQDISCTSCTITEW